MKATQREVEAMAKILQRQYQFSLVEARREARKVIKWERKGRG